VAGIGPAPANLNSEARERILAAAYDLFSRQGIRAVVVDWIIAAAGVAKTTFYRHFPSKDNLVLAFLERREQLWTLDWLETQVMNRSVAPDQRLLAVFDVFNEWFHRKDFEGCSFINVLLETAEPRNPVRQASTTHLARIRDFLRQLAEDAGVSQPDDFAHKWHMLMKGSIVVAGEGDQLAARRAGEVGRVLQAEGVRGSGRGAGVAARLVEPASGAGARLRRGAAPRRRHRCAGARRRGGRSGQHPRARRGACRRGQIGHKQVK